MTRRGRVLLSLAALISAGSVVVVLTALSSSSAGPLGTMLEWVGAGVVSIEHELRTRATGAGRATALAWFEPYRASAERLRRPSEILLGAYDSEFLEGAERLVALERTLGTTVPLIQLYTAWGDGAEHAFPVRALTRIRTLGSVGVVTWEPWLAVFDNARHPSLPLREQRDRGGFSAVARGDYDFYIDRWAADAAAYGQPFFLRFAHEMNDPYRYPWGPQNNSKEEFIAAWRHVVGRFRQAGASNAVWVWSPHVAYEWWELYYPGDHVVDWVATGVLNYGPIAQWSRWWTFAEIFGTKYPALESFGKPVMIAELGSLRVGGDRAGWYRDALTDLPRRYPAVKSVILFHASDDQTVTAQKVEWTFRGDDDVAATVRETIRSWDPGRLDDPALPQSGAETTSERPAPAACAGTNPLRHRAPHEEGQIIDAPLEVLHREAVLAAAERPAGPGAGLSERTVRGGWASPDPTVAVEIVPEALLEGLEQLDERLVRAPHLVFEQLHATFERVGLPLRLRNLAVLNQVPEQSHQVPPERRWVARLVDGSMTPASRGHARIRGA